MTTRVSPPPAPLPETWSRHDQNHGCPFTQLPVSHPPTPVLLPISVPRPYAHLEENMTSQPQVPHVSQAQPYVSPLIQTLPLAHYQQPHDPQGLRQAHQNTKLNMSLGMLFKKTSPIQSPISDSSTSPSPVTPTLHPMTFGGKTMENLGIDRGYGMKERDHPVNDMSQHDRSIIGMTEQHSAQVGDKLSEYSSEGVRQGTMRNEEVKGGRKRGLSLGSSNKGKKEDTWTEGLRTGFLSFSSTL
ncbi:hypothetical protein TREMEDRAFT_66125 [Tremella mesenterica DSM 1558]|uniref:uncharacterized protein n=1 Tax=Tremella mesenterica (strain ATCC 24925 / CBS 8224 / DSM 1558 / NBRC 9311 / NRRL Y-6157 / RJB 2259-6 / UBC 559-6) TaxID=578456 RepID=UPI00032D434D|nr:uncharacterized protein TREMEDRAFT_66125 [Tremella mesenterica DSM 1558]EIW65750.1 hypothetical protein TREMEDRAFT_66125 [Tremella mesenterica DSM 1558]